MTSVKVVFVLFQIIVATPEELRVVKTALKAENFWCVPTTGLLFRCWYCHRSDFAGISLTDWGSGIRLHRRGPTHKLLVKKLEIIMTKDGPGIGGRKEQFGSLTDVEKLGDEGACLYLPLLVCVSCGVMV